MKSFLLFLVLLLNITTLFALTPLTLEPNIRTKLESGKTYEIKENAVYTITTDGNNVDACILINTSATLVLDNCRLLTQGSDDRNAPIVINENNVNLLIRFTGQNSLAINSSSNAYSGIYINRGYIANITFAEEINVAQNTSLFIRGCSSEQKDGYQCHAPINLWGNGSVTFRSGTVYIATSEANTATPDDYKAIPSLVSTGSVMLRGGCVIAQICPRSLNAVLTYDQLTSDQYQAYVSPLFNCTTFSMSGGILSTEGVKLNLTTPLKAQNSAYDTCYAYLTRPFNNIATSQNITSGLIRGPRVATFYGMPPNTTFSTSNFAHNGSTQLSKKTSNADGLLEVQGGNEGYPNLRLKYQNLQMQAFAEIFAAPLMPTDNGIHVSANFWISHITLEGRTLPPTVTISLNLPDESVAKEKTALIQVLRTYNNETTVVYDGEVTLKRTETNVPFCATVNGQTPSPTPEGTAYYTIRAYN